jgi:U3 small nucleolar RNA-associated protein 12
VNETQAHSNEVWSISIHDKPKSYQSVVILTGGGDSNICFWELVLNKKTKSIRLQLIKKIPFQDSIQSVKFYPNGELYALALLDNSVKCCFSDSDNVSLTLYGHKLPVLSIDISSDNRILISGSADKNIKIWGLDFGNCHKSIFAH